MNDNIKKIIKVLDEKYGFIGGRICHYGAATDSINLHFVYITEKNDFIIFDFFIKEIKRFFSNEYFITYHFFSTIDNSHFMTSARSILYNKRDIEELEKYVFFKDNAESFLEKINDFHPYWMSNFADIFPESYKRYLGKQSEYKK